MLKRFQENRPAIQMALFISLAIFSLQIYFENQGNIFDVTELFVILISRVTDPKYWPQFLAVFTSVFAFLVVFRGVYSKFLGVDFFSPLAAQKEDVKNLKYYLDQEIKILQQKIKAAPNREMENFSKEIKERIVEGAKKEIDEELVSRFETKSELVELNSIASIRFERLRERIEQAIFVLSRRGTFNLILGSLSASVGVFLLAWFAFSVYETGIQRSQFDWYELYKFISRITLVLIIEVFSYFFLRLYKSSLDEIKYFQNEITNIEEIELAVMLSINMYDQEKISQSIDTLLNVERNFVLEKNQTTTEIEKARLENSHWETLAQVLGSSGVAFAKGVKSKKQ